ncbi:MAG: hypothetical protein RIS64_964 [Bacteroidota bacterium]
MLQKRRLIFLYLFAYRCIGVCAPMQMEGDTLEKQPPKPATQATLPDSVVLPKQPHWQLQGETQYMDQVVFSGRDYGIKQFAVIPKISVKHYSGFWVSVVGYYLSSVSSLEKQPISKRDIGVGFQKPVTTWWTTSIAYSRWQYFGKSEMELKYTFDYFISSYNAVQCGWLTLTPQVYAMVGHNHQSKVFQMGLGVTKYFEKRFPKDKYGVWSLQPDLTWMTSTSSTDDRYEPPTWFSGKKIQLVSYELVIPLTYSFDLYLLNKKQGQIVITPKVHFVKALHAGKYEGAKQQPFSYWTADFKYILNH